MKPIAHNFLLEIENYVPGKSKLSGSGDEIIKLSSNENALGASPKAIEVYKKHAAKISRYPDGSCEILRDALAKKNKISCDKIVCGAGSDEIISLLTYAFASVGDEVIYSEHGFLMYPISAKRVGAKAIKSKEKNLKSDVEAIIASITSKTKIIFIANPNNPTGSYLNKSEIQKIIDNTPKNILIVLDHAYEEFVDVADYPNAIDLVNCNENVVVTRTFSKIYGLASLRIGWCYSSEYISKILNKIRGPFNVSGPAQEAAVVALEDEEFFSMSKNHNKKWMKIFFEKISHHALIKAHPSVANFILLDFGSVDVCKNVNQKLLDSKIILREMSAYGLPQCLRATIGIEEENMKLLDTIS